MRVVSCRRLAFATSAVLYLWCLGLSMPVLAAADAGGLQLSSSAFMANAALPKRFSCQGAGESPPLTIAGVPSGAKSLALIVDDPDAPSGTWVHWVVYNLSPDTRQLAENAADKGLPGGGRMADNSYHKRSYGGVCPPSGTHHYRFKLYALDRQLSGSIKDKAGLVAAMKHHVIGRARLVGTYHKH